MSRSLPSRITCAAAESVAAAADQGNMELGEALCVLGVTEKRPKWLLAQVHPDKHPEREGEATQATARVNHAMADGSVRLEACD